MSPVDAKVSSGSVRPSSGIVVPWCLTIQPVCSVDNPVNSPTLTPQRAVSGELDRPPMKSYRP